MKNRFLVPFVAVASLTLAVAAVAQDKGKKDAAPGQMKKGATMTAAADQKWTPMDPNNPSGPQVAIVDGDMKGPTHFLMKAPAGFKAPLHSHTADYSAVVVQGEWSHGNTEADAKTFGPGSSWVQTGKMDHHDACTSKSGDCIVAIFVKGPMDFVPAAGATAGGDKGGDKGKDKGKK